MIEWLGIGHLFELSRAEAIAGFFTPLMISVAFFLAYLILPGRRVPGHVINPKTGKPRNYRLSGILVFAIALIVWSLEPDRKFLGLRLSTSRLVTGRSCTVVYGVLPAILITWASASLPCQSPWHSVTSPMRGLGPTWPLLSRCSSSVNVMTTGYVPKIWHRRMVRV